MKNKKKNTITNKKIQLIASYSHLNTKYDLNFSDNNFGFTWEIFKKFASDEWAEFFTTTAFYRFVPTARLTQKTWNLLAFDLWICCNFNDSSVQEVRRYENTHAETTIADLMNVCNYLDENYNINLGPENENGIKWKITKDGGSIVFPNKQQIDFIGYANGNKIFGKAAAGSSYLYSRTDEIIMAEEKETLTEKQLIYRYDRLKLSMFRSNRIKTSSQEIKELSWTFIDNNLTSPTFGKKITRYFHKTFFLAFTCNPYDKYHPFYKIYCTPYLPLNDDVREILLKTGQLSYENQNDFSELGLFIQRFTLLPFWSRLPEITKKLMLEMKKNNPDEYNTAYYGFEYANNDSTIFPFKQCLKKWQEYDLQTFYDLKKEKYKFDFFSVGIDWATGPTDHTIFIVTGFKEYKKSGYYDSFVICELVATPNDFVYENEKIEYFAQEILGLIDNFDGFEFANYFYDDKAKTAIDWLSQKLLDEFNVIINTNVAIKHESNINKEAGLENRVLWTRNTMSYGNFYANKKNLPAMVECFDNLQYDKNNSNVPDPKMYQDPYDAWFYCVYPYKDIIRGKKNGFEKNLAFIRAI